MHRDEDIAAADELLVDVDLGDGGPLRVLLDAFPQALVLKDIVGGKLFRVDALHAEDLDAGTREAALGGLGRALHEEDHGRRRNRLVDGLAHLGRQQPSLLLRLKLSEEGGRGDRVRRCAAGCPGGLSEDVL